MIIERTKKELIFRFPANLNIDDMQDLTDLFAYKEIAQKSKAKQKDVDALVKEIKKGRWEKTKQQIGL
jgi:cytochrome c551/c552